jgi:hypothetical protein
MRIRFFNLVILGLLYCSPGYTGQDKPNQLDRFVDFENQVKSLMQLYSEFTDCQTIECFVELKAQFQTPNAWESYILMTGNYLRELKIAKYRDALEKCGDHKENSAEVCSAEYQEMLRTTIEKTKGDFLD